MTLRQLSLRSLQYYFRTHLGALAGATAAAAVLIGALAVGDSVRESLKAKALERLAGSSYALATGDRFFSQDLVDRLLSGPKKEGQRSDFSWVRLPGVSESASLLSLPGSSTRQDSVARANRVNVIGVSPNEFLGGWTNQAGIGFGAPLDFSDDRVWVNPALAQQLGVKVGDSLVIRIAKPSALSRDAIVTPRDDQSVAFRGVVGGIVPGAHGGNFSLLADQSEPLNVFVSLTQFANLAGVNGRANLLLTSAPRFIKDFDGWSGIRIWLFEWASTKRFETLAGILGNQEHVASSFETQTFINAELRRAWNLADAELSVTERSLSASSPGASTPPPFVELTTRRIFLEPAAVRAALTNATPNLQPATTPTPLLTYLVNSLRWGEQLTPYSMVTAAGAPYTPTELRDDEIVVNEWLAQDLGVKPGDSVDLAYYRVDAGTQLIELTNTFRVHSIIPLQGLAADRTLMPEFPGLAKAESTRDWDAGFDLVHPIRDQDEAYWKQWRGTPKAFISLAAGQKMWANRFGDLTAIRWFPKDPSATPALREELTRTIRENLDPAEVGLVWQPIRESALKAATSGQDFGGLFLGFSFFLIISALLLTSMLFQFGLEQRAAEAGILLAIGWSPGRVRRLLFREGFMLAILGSVLGAGLGALYAKGVIWGLSTLWRDAVAGAGIQFYLTFTTLITGVVLSLGVAAATLWLALRRQVRRPARELLNQGAGDAVPTAAGVARWIRWGAWISTALGLGLTAAGWARRETNPEMFFGAGALLLMAALLWVRRWIAYLATPDAASQPVRSISSLALRGLTRRPSRSVGTVALLASAAFLIVAVAANRLEATRNATLRSSGTGGFALWGESTLPIQQHLNTRKGQEFYGLEPSDLPGLAVVGFRVRNGDDASCLNLNRAQHPRLLGVEPQALAQRGAFTFSKLLKELKVTNGWMALASPLPLPPSQIPEIPALGDANTIQYGLGKSVGDTVDYSDERGQPFKVRIVGAIANSVLQGSLIISDADFVRYFPSESGQRAFLMDAAGDPTQLSASLSRALQDVGLELTPTVLRLNRFNAVQNTYLNTFQVLGGLGLLLGSIGLGVVVVRNVFERRGELALLQAVGFERPTLRHLVLREHVVLLLAGLGLGAFTAGLAVLPSLLSPGSGVPWGSLAGTLLLVLVNGIIWTVIAVGRALRGRLPDGLREL